jgi:putative ABC transport system substrate-binding protein
MTQSGHWVCIAAMDLEPLRCRRLGFGADMQRREFITLIGGAAVTWPIAARAQRPAMPVIGFLSSFSETQSARPIAEFRRGLNDNGLTEGQGVTFEFRFADGRYDRLPALAAELVHHPVDLIFAAAPPAALAAKAATTSIPIVFVVGFDPVTAGLVASLSRPGGNITGMTLFSNPLAQKRLEVLLELAPKASVIAMLVNSVSPDTAPEVRAVEEMTQQRGLQLRLVNASSLSEIDTAVAALAEKRPHALLVASDPFYLSRPDEIVASVARLALPAIYPFREFAAAGGLVSYGTNRPVIYRQAGAYASRILKGTKTVDLPVMQPATFELVINLKAAKTLGLDVPHTLLTRADEVIE